MFVMNFDPSLIGEQTALVVRREAPPDAGRRSACISRAMRVSPAGADEQHVEALADQVGLAEGQAGLDPVDQGRRSRYRSAWPRPRR